MCFCEAMNEVDYKQLFQEGKKYLKLELNYSKLTMTEKLAVLLSAIATITVIVVLGAFILSYLGSTLATAISQAAGAAWIGNIVVAALFLVVLLVVLALKKPLIVNPITRFLSKLFLTPDDNE